MPDKFTKSHPWRLTILRRFDQQIGALVVNNIRTGGETEVAPATTIPQEPGERMFKTRRDAQAICDQFRAAHGDDICTDVFRVHQ